MKKLLFVMMVMAAMVVSTAKADNYQIKVGEFDELVVNDRVNVVYSSNPDSVGYVTFDIKPQFASYIIANRTKSKLKIELDPAAEPLKNLPTVYVYSSFLSKAENNKDSTLYIRDVRPGAKLSLQIQGNGKIVARNLDVVDMTLRLLTGKGTIIASGKCTTLTLDNVGAGEIQADEVEARDVKCRVMGTGTIGCAPTKTLSINGLGSGKVYYKGYPQITKGKLSNVKFEPLGDNSATEQKVTVTETDDAAMTECDDSQYTEEMPADNGRKPVVD